MTAGKVRRLGAATLAGAVACLVMVVGQATADNTQTLTVAGVTVDEAAGTADFVVKLSAGPDDATFNYATGDGSAKAGSDYTSKSDTNVTVPGGGEVTISVAITNDDLFEGAQSFTFNITNIAKASNTTASAPGNITDNDPAPSVSVSPTATSVSEGNTAEVILSLANKSEADVTVSYVKQNQSAADGDYSVVGTSRTWTSGQTGDKPAIQAPTTQDLLDEDDETFRINFASTVQLSSSFAQVTITDNDPEVTVGTVSDATRDRGEHRDGRRVDHSHTLSSQRKDRHRSVRDRARHGARRAPTTKPSPATTSSPLGTPARRSSSRSRGTRCSSRRRSSPSYSLRRPMPARDRTCAARSRSRTTTPRRRRP